MTDAELNQDMPDLKFIEFVVKQIVDHPDDVEINRKVDELGVLVTLRVHKDDMGQIIGKNGQTAKALRILLRVIGSKHNARVNFKIEEPVGAEGGSPETAEANEEAAE